jgi:hypothetical protein
MVTYASLKVKEAGVRNLRNEEQTPNMFLSQVWVRPLVVSSMSLLPQGGEST